MKYSPEHIAKAMRKERMGGTCLISICGAGETMAQKEAVDIAALLLKEGHYVNITTNGTLTNRFDALIDACGDAIQRLHISFSLHFIELQKKGWIDRFFDNVCKMRDAGASILLQMNLCDAYVPYLDEIKRISMDRVGAWPQLALTRDEKKRPMKIYTVGNRRKYTKQGKTFDSPLFDFTVKNFNVRRKEFCYAGEWSGVLNLSTGVLKKCYFDGNGVDIFADVNAPIDFKPVGWECRNVYCVNSSHFMSLGVIPSIKTPTYGQLRNRPSAKWQTPQMEQFLNTRLFDNNPQYTKKELRYMARQFREQKLRGWLAGFKLYQFLHRLKER